MATPKKSGATASKKSPAAVEPVTSAEWESKWAEEERRRQQARDKADDPHMTTANNPLATETYDDYQRAQMIERNMEKLYADQHARRKNPVYAAIMDIRFNKEQ